MKRLLLPLLLLAACAPPPVRDELRIEPSADDDSVVVRVDTELTLDPANDRVRERVEAARSAAMTNTDPWAVRFGRVSAQEEHVTYHKERGQLDRVTRAVRIRANDLQQVLADTNITVNVMDGDGWRELTFYPGTSARATREQQRRFEEQLGSWSRSVARYFVTIDHVYVYLRENPHRERDVFAALLNEQDVEVLEDEVPLIEAAARAMEEIGTRMDEEEARASTFAEEADLIFNPFPGRVTVRVPRDVLASEGFEVKGSEAVIEPIDLFAIIAELEGKWISPDPLAALLRDDKPSLEQLVEAERKSTPVVNASEVAAAIRERLARPRTYSIRWRD